MTTAPSPEEHPPDGSLTALVGERRHLINLAYRLLGSFADAEDVVQETYARWYAMSPGQRDAVESPGAWMTKVASRICLDLLRSARARRESYVGEWIPEPLPDRAAWVSGRPGSAPEDPVDRVTLDESITMAFLVVLESMTPAERVAFVLHDVFGYPFADVAEIVGRTPGACRQLASSARRRVASVHAQRTPGPQLAETVSRFKQAWEDRDVPALVSILDPDVTAVADGGGLVSAMLVPIEGAPLVAQTLVEIAAREPGMTIRERRVNGLPGLVVQRDDVVETVLAFEGAHGRIRSIWAVRNPEKLRRWAPA
ncbi:RNA polymerase sigma factor SigJ [Nocardioides antri]|uniref:Sigma-70 family RNA polymerase sigma factor n=1 Tax=Nocardioides antri TaxID=2607659 RepID=A0A5B1M094_9ACTN|nr:RNA polymerase sigma factor SigJ [Nocardioides antri]KAA1426151.1 sigma-70 family RNA polymerase sigma factor [Nocardioides antri]